MLPRRRPPLPAAPGAGLRFAGRQFRRQWQALLVPSSLGLAWYRQGCRFLHSAGALRNDSQSHYDTLKVPPDASPGAIKKSFYALSKAHHPDHNPSDPHAQHRFMRISEAYSVIGSPDKRATYDRDVLPRHHPHQHRQRSHHHGGSQGGSYSSTGPAGGRPASGLSRRRGTFRGPPPSFYRSGGWGAHTEKRKAAQDDSGGAGAGTSGGMNYGQSPYGHANEPTPSHFDKPSHERTHRREEERRARRMAGTEGPVTAEPGVMGGFVGICAILVASVAFPWFIVGGWRKRRKDRERVAI